MPYDGLEVDMLSVGNADSILVTNWVASNNTVSRVLIDGANKLGADVVKAFLKNNKITWLDAVVCTHPHDDHAAGLVELLKDESIGIGSAYMHIPHWHADVPAIKNALSKITDSAEADSIRKSLATVEELYAAFNARKIGIFEPFSGIEIQFLTVVGPSQEYYEELVTSFGDSQSVKSVDTRDQIYKIWAMLHDKAQEQLGTELPPDPQTTPENNSSVILATIRHEKKFLFTADAGVPALQKASEAYDLSKCYWMQIPHHGSRRNINPALINVFAPDNAWVSAEGSKKHPRRAVVNAFKEAGAEVCSTHYPQSTNMRIFTGTVPTRVGYTPLIPLYEADALTEKPSDVTSFVWSDSLLRNYK